MKVIPTYKHNMEKNTQKKVQGNKKDITKINKTPKPTRGNRKKNPYPKIHAKSDRPDMSHKPST